MRPLAVGVIGHVDHGKTALVRALTGMETDRLAEEKRRGISIALGFAWLALPAGTIDLIDMPGHERFVRTMVAGAAGIGGVLLAVSARDGIRPQTVEHVRIAGLLGVRLGIVAVTQCDLVPADRAAAVAAGAVRLLAENGMADAPAIHTCAPRGHGIGPLRDALAGLLLGRAPPPPDQGLAFLPIDRAFSVPGFGPVVTGTLQHGRLTNGQELELVPHGARTRVRTLQVHGRPVAEALPGGRTAVNLRGVTQEAVARGLALATPGLVHAAEWLDVRLQTLPDTGPRPLEGGRDYTLLLAAGEVPARLRLLDRDVLEPGAAAPAQLRCRHPVAVPARTRFVLRAGSPPVTVAGGLVIDTGGTRRRRHDPAVLDRMRALAAADPQGAVALLLGEAGPAGVTLAAAARVGGTTPAWVISWLPGLGACRAGDRAVTLAALAGIEADLPEALARFHRQGPDLPGATAAMLAHALPDAAGPVLDLALDRLVRQGSLACTAGRYRLPGFRPGTEGVEAALACRIEAAIRDGGLSPPDPDALPGGRIAVGAVRRMLRDGLLIRARDRVQKRDFLFHRDAVAEAARHLATAYAARTEGFSVGEAGRLLGISRKYCVPLLEHLDGAGITRRMGERRIVRAGASAG